MIEIVNKKELNEKIAINFYAWKIKVLELHKMQATITVYKIFMEPWQYQL